jgi:hydrogenase-4 membrane subunit HyfE
MFTRILSMATVFVLAATLPLAVIAVRGYWQAPFRRLLGPLPVIIGALVALHVPAVLAVDPPVVYATVVSSLAVAASFAMAFEALFLLTGRRKL